MWLAHHIMPRTYMHKFKVKVYTFYVLLTTASQYACIWVHACAMFCILWGLYTHLATFRRGDKAAGGGADNTGTLGQFRPKIVSDTPIKHTCADARTHTQSHGSSYNIYGYLNYTL